MRLKSVHVREFKSVWDSNEFTTGDVTCLVGKNEAGKTAILQALYRLNPVVDSDSVFDVTEDYPRLEVEDYQQDLASGRRQSIATPITAVFTIEDGDVAKLEEAWGRGILLSRDVSVSRRYESAGIASLWIIIRVDETVAVKTLLGKANLPEEVAGTAATIQTLKGLEQFLIADAEQRSTRRAAAQARAGEIQDPSEKAAALESAKHTAESEAAEKLRNELPRYSSASGFSMYVWQHYLRERLPRFLYFDEYYQMTGQVNVTALRQRLDQGKLEPSDRPMLGLIEQARLDLEKLDNPQRTQDLKNKLEGAANHLLKQVLKYWSQNKHLAVRFDVRPALPGDPPGMNQAGTMNLWGEVYDSAHGATVRIGTRSRGFIWFFSFLAWFSQQRRRGVPLILLLDEPGLVLHATAQADLLRYIDAELTPHHQVVYTTHSPFMIDAAKFYRVRIVRDRSMDDDEPLPVNERGTKVVTDVLEADPHTLFPLLGALGYDIAQTLFVGPNCLIVEGVSDVLFLQTMSGVLAAAGREALDPEWAITPVGGADKMPAFVSLLGSENGLRIATLIDLQKKDRGAIENLYKRNLLERRNVLTFANFTGTREADIEDMFDAQFYLDVVNAEYEAQLSKPIELKDLKPHPRIVVRIAEYLASNPLTAGSFSLHRSARCFAKNIETLSARIDKATLDRFEEAFKKLNDLFV